MKFKKTLTMMLVIASMTIGNFNFDFINAITKEELDPKEELVLAGFGFNYYNNGEDAAYASLKSLGYLVPDVVQFIVERGYGSENHIDELKAMGYTDIDYSAAYARLGQGQATTQNNPTPAPAPKTPTHTHTYVEEITTEPTCMEEGVLTYVCDCGDSYTEAIAVIEHQYESSVIKEPGCVEDGETGYTCSLCGDSYSEAIPTVGHVEGSLEVVTKAGCVTEGVKESRCTTCGEVLTTEVISATGHTNGEWVIEKKSTMIEKGKNVLRCSTCNEVLEVQEIPLAMMGWYVIGGIVVLIVVGVAVMAMRKKK